MKLSKKKEKKHSHQNHGLIRQITKLSLLICILFVIKLKFLLAEVIDGPELVTFCLVFYGLFLRFKECILIIIVFNLLCGAFYGFGTWLITYWYMWPGELILTKCFAKIFTFNIWSLCGWMSFLCFTIWIWYFFSDWYFFGLELAIYNVPVGAFTNATSSIFVIPATLILSQPIFYIFNKFHWNTVDLKRYRVWWKHFNPNKK